MTSTLIIAAVAAACIVAVAVAATRTGCPPGWLARQAQPWAAGREDQQ